MSEFFAQLSDSSTTLGFAVGILFSVLRGLTPLLFAALAGIISERSGVVQIALEGFLLAGALAASLITLQFGNPWFGFFGAGFTTMLFGLLMALFVVELRADGIIAGTAINLLILGLCPLFTKVLYQSTGSTPSLPIESRFTWEPALIAVVALVLVTFLIQQTRLGLWFRFAGEAPKALTASGVSVRKVRWVALGLTGFLAGLGGASLSLFLASSYSPNMSAGRGFMALAAVIIGGWRPIPAAFACLTIAGFDSAQVYLQSLDWKIPVQWIQILPYLFTILVLTLGLSGGRAPKFLGRSTE